MRLLMILMLINSCSNPVQFNHMQKIAGKIKVGDLRYNCERLHTNCRQLGYIEIDNTCEKLGYKQGEILFEGMIAGKMVYTYGMGSTKGVSDYYMQYKCVNK